MTRRTLRFRPWTWLALIPLLVLCLPPSPVRADEAVIELKDGRQLRGDVRETDAEVILVTSVGELRIPRDQVLRVRPVTPRAATAPSDAGRSTKSPPAADDSVDAEYARRLAALAPDDADGHFALAEWAEQRGRYDLVAEQCRRVLRIQKDHAKAMVLLRTAERRLTQPPPDRPAPERPAPAIAVGEGRASLAQAPLASEKDINRLKLYEYARNGEPEKVRVKFKRKPGEPELPALVLADASNLQELGDGDRRKLERGKPHEQLQVILAATDMRYADRIEVRSNTETFETFRRRVLPHVVQGCATAGCHAGEAAAVFRLPKNPTARDATLFTSFLILDRIQTKDGPLINRENPSESVLLSYLLPPEVGPHHHPPVKRGAIKPVLRSRNDRNHDHIVEWIRALRSPHPRYVLDYKYPDWLPEPPPPASAPAENQGDGR
jgi:hypothetical protein